MKKVTTNMSLGQLLFVVFTVLLSSLMFFYLGAKFGPQLLKLSESRHSLEEGFLPDDQLAQEINQILAEAKTDFTFFDVVQSKKKFPGVKSSSGDIPRISMIQDEPKVKTPDKVEIRDLLAEESKKDVEEKKPEPKPKEKPKVVKVEAPKVNKPVEEKPKAKTVEKVVKPEIEPKEEIKKELEQAKYLLQVGSYSSLKKAEKQKEVWEGRGYKPQIVVAQIPGKGQWYRLRLGLYNNYDSIQSQQKSIMKKYKQTAMILPIQ